MTLTSFSFLCFFLVTVLVYYILPKGLQWIVLLFSSLIFYALSGGFGAFCFLLYGIFGTWLGALWIEKCPLDSRKRRVSTAVLVVLTLLPLFLLKYIRFFGIPAPFGSLAPLGISFYTMTILGYVIDVSWGVVPAQRNLARHALFAGYFPQMISGPITRYSSMKEQLYTAHSFSYENLTYGAQRMLWGFFQKLVISQRLAGAVDLVYGSYPAYPGWFVGIATVCFAFQLYTDFSGCMDIVLGASQILGISLPENFHTPYFSRSISEYWRRWHITLGAWFKDYLFYPLQKSSLWSRFLGWSKGRFGKKRGKKPPLYTGMLILWFSVGMWHGGSWNFIVGSGLLHWFYIVSGELLAPLGKRLNSFFHIHTETFGWRLFQMLRTFFLVNLGFVFFRAPSLKTALSLLKSMGTVWNPQILFDQSLFLLMPAQDWVLAIFSLLLLLLVSVLRQKMKLRAAIAGQNLVLRWGIYLLLFTAVLLFGCYGGDYDAASFIYQRF